MGVVSGIVMEYQLGTNWARFSQILGNTLGPLFAYEVLTAFFLEASFLGVMLFGWDRFPPWLHPLASSSSRWARQSPASGSWRPIAGCRRRPATPSRTA